MAAIDLDLTRATRSARSDLELQLVGAPARRRYRRWRPRRRVLDAAHPRRRDRRARRGAACATRVVGAAQRRAAALVADRAAASGRRVDALADGSCASAIRHLLGQRARWRTADRAAADAPRDALRARARPADELRIRVYPDDINTIDHEPAPTAAELKAGVAYWSARFAHNDDEAERLVRDLASRISAAAARPGSFAC